MDKSSFILYTDYYEQIELLTIEQRGVLLTACMLYQLGRELPEMDPITKMAYMFISADIRRNNESTKLSSRDGVKRGRKGASKLKQIEQMLLLLLLLQIAKTSKIKQNKQIKQKQAIMIMRM